MREGMGEYKDMSNVLKIIFLGIQSTITSVSSISSSSNSNNEFIQYYVEEYNKWSNKQRKLIVDDLLQFVNHSLPLCCKKECSSQFSVRDVQKYRYDTLREGNERKRMIMRLAIEEKQRNKEKKFIICGRNVCSKFAKFARGVSNSSVYSNYTKRTSNDGVLVSDDEDLSPNEEDEDILRRNEDIPKLSFKRTMIINFFNELIIWNEKMPDVNEIHLPHGNKKELFFNFLTDCRVLHQNFNCSYNYFIQIWFILFPHVKLRKHSRFTLCDDCVRFKEQINSTISQSIKNLLRTENYKHKFYIKKEKYGYYTKRYMAVSYPNKYVSIRSLFPKDGHQ